MRPLLYVVVDVGPKNVICDWEPGDVLPEDVLPEDRG